MTRFGQHYDEWTERRIGWILANFGDDVFRGRSVLDIGGGRGHVAERLLDLGASSVEVVEGRLGNIRAGAVRDGLTFTHANLERGLPTAAEAYDVVINFGVIYHVVNWERMLVESVAKARELVLIETEVIDSETEPTHYLIEEEDVYDFALAGIATRPSEFEIDRLLARVPNAQPAKRLDPALNAGFHRYDWEPQLAGLTENGLRRFWTVARTPVADPQAERVALDRLFAEIHQDKAIDTLMIARRTQQLIERKPTLGAAGRASAEPPPGLAAPPGPRPPLDARGLLSVLTMLRPLQNALELVYDEGGLDDLDRSRKLPDRAYPYSCTDEEGLVLYHVIAANGLKTGFEVATAFGYSTAFIGLALQRNRGTLISMDCYVEEWKESFDYEKDELMVAVTEVLERVERDEPPRGLAFASEQLGALDLEDVVTLSIGVSPESVPDAIFGRAIDFALIDGGHFGEQPTDDFVALIPNLDQRCAVFFHDNNDNPAVARAVAAAETMLGSQAIVFPTRYRLTLVGRNLDPGSVSAADALLTRSRA